VLSTLDYISLTNTAWTWSWNLFAWNADRSYRVTWAIHLFP